MYSTPTVSLDLSCNTKGRVLYHTDDKGSNSGTPLPLTLFTNAKSLANMKKVNVSMYVSKNFPDKPRIHKVKQKQTRTLFHRN